MTSAIRDALVRRAPLPDCSTQGVAEAQGKWLIILPPCSFLLVFFLIPFGFA